MNKVSKLSKDDPFAALKALGPLKTWSLLATVFGDLAPQRGQWLESHVLGVICGWYDVKPEALRVALHRLRKDGWLEAEKRGRRSAYTLSAVGEAQTAAASARIYRSPCEEPARWYVTLEETRGAVGAGAHVSASADPRGGFGFDAGYEEVPEWLRRSVKTAGADDGFAAFVTAAEGAEALGLGGRLLVLHHWRRLVLRQPDGPEQLLGPDWQGYAARCAAARVFAAVARPAPEELAAQLGTA